MLPRFESDLKVNFVLSSIIIVFFAAAPQIQAACPSDQGCERLVRPAAPG
jgi:hypothetical protein